MGCKNSPVRTQGEAVRSYDEAAPRSIDVGGNSERPSDRDGVMRDLIAAHMP